MIRLLLVDDHASFRGALAFMIDREDDLSVVAEAGTVADARQVLQEKTIDIALLDLDLPDGDGLDLLPDIYRSNPSAAVAVLTGSIRPESQALAIAAGASGFLHKSSGVAEIIRAIRKMAGGEPLLSPAEAMALLRQATSYQARIRQTQRALETLTSREGEVLRALASGLDNQAIADRLSLSTATVRTHVVHILQKLGVDSRLQAALIAVHHDMVDTGEIG